MVKIVQFKFFPTLKSTKLVFNPSPQRKKSYSSSTRDFALPAKRRETHWDPSQEEKNPSNVPYNILLGKVWIFKGRELNTNFAMHISVVLPSLLQCERWVASQSEYCRQNMM